jgi:DNA-binding HxlR family transcriptional regulator
MTETEKSFQNTQIKKLTHYTNQIADAWTLLIVFSLSLSPKRFNELASSVPTINRATLSNRLKTLSEIGILERQVGNEMPPSTTYFLTPMGKGMSKILEEINKFGNKFLDSDE